MGKTKNRNPETLEDARALLLEDNEELEQLREQISTLEAQITEKDESIENLRTLNQSYYLRLSQGRAEDENDEGEDDEEPQSLEDFARTKLKGVIK